MATEPMLAALDVSAVPDRQPVPSTVLYDYWALTKPEINFLIAITAGAAFTLGSPAALRIFRGRYSCTLSSARSSLPVEPRL
jgi:heme O synthase-like polyprenyltransferase